MTAREQAAAQFAEIRETMLALGRPTSVAEIATASGLPPRVVRLRLVGNCHGKAAPALSFFEFSEAGWSLSALGMGA